MVDIALFGDGTSARRCGDALREAGYSITADPNEDAGRVPLILGDAANAFALALRAVEAGRHLMVTSPQALSLQQTETLLAFRAFKPGA